MLLAATLALLLGQSSQTATPRDFTHEPKAAFDKRMNWFREARFGMFIHWGLYSVPAGTWNGKVYGGASEWLMNSARVPVADWEPLKSQFNPVNFDAKKWVSIAKGAGMKYIVITSKHHEGFAMWPSKIGDWNIGYTQFKRDPLKELAAECKKQGLKLCFYHSIMDWHHPDFVPREDYDKRPTDKVNFENYVSVLKGQLKELLTQYGPIGILWFDGEWKGWNHERGKDLYNYVRGFQPNLIVNNRVDVGRGGMGGMTNEGHVGDYGTPEQEIPATGVATDWESCMTMNGSWGFHAHDTNWKSADTLIYNVVDCASKGGNYLLNVGPTSLGEIPQASIDRLAQVGAWMDKYGEAVYKTSASPFPKALPWGKVTRKGNSLYLIVFDTSKTELALPGLQTKVNRVRVLGAGAASASTTANGWKISLDRMPKVAGPCVVKIDLAGKPDVVEAPLTQGADGKMELTAQEAVIKGTTAVLEGGEKQAIGYWSNVNDTVSWDFVVTKPGMFDVSVQMACEPGSENSTFDVMIGGQRISGTTHSTGSWSKFETVNLGMTKLVNTGSVKVTVIPTKITGQGLMNLRRITLTPRSLLF